MSWSGRKARILQLLETSPSDSLLRSELVVLTNWPEVEVRDLVEELRLLGRVRVDHLLSDPPKVRVILISNEHRAHETAATT